MNGQVECSLVDVVLLLLLWCGGENKQQVHKSACAKREREREKRSEQKKPIQQVNVCKILSSCMFSKIRVQLFNCKC